MTYMQFPHPGEYLWRLAIVRRRGGGCGGGLLLLLRPGNRVV